MSRPRQPFRTRPRRDREPDLAALDPGWPGQQALLVLLGVAAAVVAVGLAWQLAAAIADGVDGDTGGLTRAVLVIVVLVGLRASLAWATPWVGAVAASRLKSRLRLRHLASYPAAALDQPVPVGRMVGLVVDGVNALDAYVGRYRPARVLAGVVPVMVLAAIGGVDGWSALIVAVTLPLVPVFMVLVGWLTREVTERRWRSSQRLRQHLADLILGLPTLQLFDRAAAQLPALRATADRSRRETIRTLRLAFLSALVLELISTLCVALVAVTVGLRVLDGSLALGDGLYVLILTPEAYAPLRRLGAAFHDAADARAVLAELASPQAKEPPVEDGSCSGPLEVGTAMPEPRPALLEAVGVAYHYPGTPGRAGLRPLSLSVARGEVIAVTGPSGTGKSTLLSLLLGVHSAQQGVVRVDGRPLPPERGRVWRARVGWVPQRPRLLIGTVAENVALADPHASRAELAAALAAAGAPHLGLDRVVGERAANLSVGEIRRVALARALLRLQRGTADLLLLDEPTAGLDQDAERSVLARVLGLARAGGVATIVVTHHPEVLAWADRVIALEQSAAEVRAPTPALGDAVTWPVLVEAVTGR